MTTRSDPLRSTSAGVERCSGKSHSSSRGPRPELRVMKAARFPEEFFVTLR